MSFNGPIPVMSGKVLIQAMSANRSVWAFGSAEGSDGLKRRLHLGLMLSRLLVLRGVVLVGVVAVMVSRVGVAGVGKDRGVQDRLGTLRRGVVLVASCCC